MEEYKPNSFKYKAEQKEVSEKAIEKVTKGAVTAKKKNEIRRITDRFFAEDASGIANHAWKDIFVPAAKKVVSDIVKDGIDMIMYGAAGASGRRSGTADYVSYREYSERNDCIRDTRKRTGLEFDELIFENCGDAKAVLTQMREVIRRYGVVTVADLYDMANPNITPPHTSNKYGWVNLQNAEPLCVRGGGWILKLPPAMPIE